MSDASKPKATKKTDSQGHLNGIRGFLPFYLFLMGYQLAHGLVLTVGSIVLYNDPALAKTQDFSLPLGGLLLYDISNLILAALGIVFLVLAFKRKKAAIVWGLALSVLWPVALFVWHVAGEKSHFGTIVDTLPNIISIFYLLLSKRVKATFVR
jgi:hypothetical protein